MDMPPSSWPLSLISKAGSGRPSLPFLFVTVFATFRLFYCASLDPRRCSRYRPHLQACPKPITAHLSRHLLPLDESCSARVTRRSFMPLYRALVSLCFSCASPLADLRSSVDSLRCLATNPPRRFLGPCLVAASFVRVRSHRALRATIVMRRWSRFRPCPHLDVHQDHFGVQGRQRDRPRAASASPTTSMSARGSHILSLRTAGRSSTSKSRMVLVPAPFKFSPGRSAAPPRSGRQAG